MLAFENKEKNESKGIGCLSYVLGGLSFIPLIGVVFGVIVIVLGIIKRKIGGWKLILIGSLGIIFTIVLYGSLFYKGFIERGGTFDELSKQLAQTQLTDLVKHIEYYKIQNGNYPSNLKVFQPKDGEETKSFIFVNDPMNKELSLGEPSLYYYELINEGKNYYLFSSGIDGIPFSSDDVHPIVSIEEFAKIGYIKKH